MTKQKRNTFFLILFVLFLVGCDTSPAEVAEIPKEKEAITQWAERTKSFGNQDFTASREEAETDLESRFQLEFTPTFINLENLVKDEFVIDGVTANNPEVRIQATERQLNVTEQMGFFQGENAISYANLMIDYKYLDYREQVKVDLIGLEISFWTGGDSYIGTDFQALIEAIGIELKIPEKDLEEGLEKLAVPNEHADQQIEIFNDLQMASEERTVGQSLSVELGEDRKSVV